MLRFSPAALAVLLVAKSASAQTYPDLPPPSPPANAPPPVTPGPYAAPPANAPPPITGPYAAPPPGAPAPIEPGRAAPPPYPPPAPPPREGWDLDNEAFGGRFASLSTSGGSGSKSTLGGSFAMFGIQNYATRWLTTRYVGRAAIGGGGGGLEGELGGTASFGPGFLVDGHQGAFARIGVSGYLVGNDSFWQSAIAFPQGSLGWHVGGARGYLFELGGTIAPMLDGRFDVGDQGRRRLGSSAVYGAYADMIAGPFAMNFAWERTDAVSQPGTAVDALHGHACLAGGTSKKSHGLALCFDARHTRGDVHYGAPATFASAESTYLGVTLGFGYASRKHP